MTTFDIFPNGGTLHIALHLIISLVYYMCLDIFHWWIFKLWVMHKLLSRITFCWKNPWWSSFRANLSRKKLLFILWHQLRAFIIIEKRYLCVVQRQTVHGRAMNNKKYLCSERRNHDLMLETESITNNWMVWGKRCRNKRKHQTEFWNS